MRIIPTLLVFFAAVGNLAAEDPVTHSKQIKAMEKIADLALIPPKLNTTPLPEYDYDKLDYGMTIGIERTPGGRLWACWVAGGDSPKAFFVLATSFWSNTEKRLTRMRGAACSPLGSQKMRARRGGAA